MCTEQSGLCLAANAVKPATKSCLNSLQPAAVSGRRTGLIGKAIRLQVEIANNDNLLLFPSFGMWLITFSFSLYYCKHFLGLRHPPCQ